MEFNPNQISGQCGPNIFVEPAPLIPHTYQLTHRSQTLLHREAEWHFQTAMKFPIQYAAMAIDIWAQYPAMCFILNG